MKLGILGTGMIVKDLMNIINDLSFEKVTILGTEGTRSETEEITATYGFSAPFYDYDDLLASDVDTIYVALPNHLHFSFSKKALEKGKNVIIEKPIVLHADELVELKSIADKNSLIMLEAMNIHYVPSFISLKEKLHEVGKIKVVSLNYSQYSSRYNDFKEGLIHPAFDFSKGGGALMDINVYNIHFVVGLFGKPENYEYYPNLRNGVDTSGVMVLNYGDFKAVCIGAKDCRAPTLSTIQGDCGSILINIPVNQMSGYSLDLNEGVRSEISLSEKHRLLSEFNEFIRIINTRDFEKAAEMLHISATVTDIIASSRSKFSEEEKNV